MKKLVERELRLLCRRTEGNPFDYTPSFSLFLSFRRYCCKIFFVRYLDFDEGMILVCVWISDQLA